MAETKADGAGNPVAPPWAAPAETKASNGLAPSVLPWEAPAETKPGTGRAPAAAAWDAPPDATMIGPPLILPESPRRAGTDTTRTVSPAPAPSRPGPADAAASPAPSAPVSPAAKVPTEVPPDSAEFYMPLARRPAPDDDSPNPVLPVPPSDSEKYAYVRRHAWVLTLCAALSIPPLVYGQVRMVLNSPWFWVYVPFALFGVLCFILSVTADGMSRSFDLDEHKRIVASWMPLWHPSVDVFLPVCGEPLEVLRNAWTHVSRLRNHYPGQVTPYVLDDSANPEIKAMARRFGFAYATRPDRGRFKKSGNLLYGFTISDGDYILLLDADFAPRPDLLDETIPYMALFPDVGIVQTPQYFHVLDEQTWVERGAGASQELFYRSIQTARANRDAAICVGSCAVYRRKALEENKGMSLAEHSEDLHTGFDLRRLGWSLRYLPIALSTGNCPDNILAFLNQQYRWCSGTMSLLSNKKFWQTKLPLRTRLCYLSGFLYYVQTALFAFIIPMLSVGLVAFDPGILQLRNLIFFAPILLYSGVIYPMWHRVPYRLEAWSVKIISAWAHIFALSDIMRGSLRGWQPSGSNKTKQDGRRRFWIGLIGWSFLSAAVWTGISLWRMLTLDPGNFFLLFVLGAFELVVVGRILLQPRAGVGS
jgi:cellulose synthase (UDP-forming)